LFLIREIRDNIVVAILCFVSSIFRDFVVVFSLCLCDSVVNIVF